MVVAVVQARLTSTRLPGKVLRPILGRPLLWHIVHRLGHARLVERIVIATARGEANRPIVDFAREHGIACYAGSEDDLLDRLYQAARRYAATTVVKVTGDCPLVDPGVVDRVVGYYLEHRDRFDCVGNFTPPTYPHGLEVAVFSMAAVERGWREVTDPFWREWATMSFFDHPEKYRLGNVAHHEDLSHLRWTVDYEDDLAFVTKVYERLYREDKIFGMEEVLELLRRHPELMEINRGHQPNERYQEARRQRLSSGSAP